MHDTTITPHKSWPKTTGALIDKAYRLRQERLLLQKDAEKLKAEEGELQGYLLQKVGRERLTGAKGKVAQISFKQITVANLVDYDKVIAYAKKTGVPLFQRRLNQKAIHELWDDDKRVPGVEQYDDYRISLTKV